MRFCAQLLIVMLVMSLGLQLSGLSCLEDWRSNTSAELILQGTDHSASSSAELGADGCPCHLLFFSSPQSGLGAVEQSRSMNTMAPTGWLPTLASVLFHPPLV